MIQRVQHWCWLCFLAVGISPISSFLVHRSTTPTFALHGRHLRRHMMFDTSFVVGVVEVFDGSTIVDPVVVSDVFWASLRGKVVAVVIGQVLATIAFGIFSWFLSSQISQLFDRVASTFSKGTTQQDPPSKFIKANEIRSFYRPPPDFGKLLICLAIDVIGSSSEVIPFLGEITDVIYAPIAATILRNLYGSNILFGLEFVEEILPFTDVLPLATIWYVKPS